ncbi:MAG: HAD hydrolase-like protein [Fimbriimonadaceae bacterium]|nr:HAD hydrolase-like protein [Fimbriimonadaceae bacterium]QYK55355.1 MAG: HAD hydrolase-like protein [Fimbriimonadaceae bacterium]
MAIQLALFDIAGTALRDGSNVVEAVAAAMAENGYPRDPEACRQLMGLPKPLMIAELLGEDSDPNLVRRIHDDFVTRMVRFYHVEPGVCEVEGASTVFERLRGAGVKVALDTSLSRPVADAMIYRTGWADRIDASVACDEVSRGRPHTNMIFEAMRRTGVEMPGHVAKVGDTPSDIQAGLSAGCGLVVGVTYGMHSREELRGTGVELADSISEACDMVLAAVTA